MWSRVVHAVFRKFGYHYSRGQLNSTPATVGFQEDGFVLPRGCTQQEKKCKPGSEIQILWTGCVRLDLTTWIPSSALGHLLQFIFPAPWVLDAKTLNVRSEQQIDSRENCSVISHDVIQLDERRVKFISVKRAVLRFVWMQFGKRVYGWRFLIALTWKKLMNNTNIRRGFVRRCCFSSEMAAHLTHPY